MKIKSKNIRKNEHSEDYLQRKQQLYADILQDSIAKLTQEEIAEKHNLSFCTVRKIFIECKIPLFTESMKLRREKINTIKEYAALGMTRIEIARKMDISLRYIREYRIKTKSNKSKSIFLDERKEKALAMRKEGKSLDYIRDALRCRKQYLVELFRENNVSRIKLIH